MSRLAIVQVNKSPDTAILELVSNEIMSGSFYQKDELFFIFMLEDPIAFNTNKILKSILQNQSRLFFINSHLAFSFFGAKLYDTVKRRLVTLSIRSPMIKVFALDKWLKLIHMEAR